MVSRGLRKGRRLGRPASVVETALDILERKELLPGKNPWVWAAAGLWLASFKRLGLLKALAEAVGTTTASVRNAAKRTRVKVWKIRQHLPALARAEASEGWAWGCGFCEDAGHMRRG